MLKGDVQESYPSIKDKILHGAVSDGDNFLLVACKDYDRKIGVFSTVDSNFGVKIKANVEPGNFLVHDMMKEDNHLRILTQEGNHVFIETIDTALANEGRPEHSVLQVVEEKHYHAPSFSWPYLSYATKHNKVFIHNAFNQNHIQRYELPNHISIIADTFVTDF